MTTGIDVTEGAEGEIAGSRDFACCVGYCCELVFLGFRAQKCNRMAFRIQKKEMSEAMQASAELKYCADNNANVNIAYFIFSQ